jgi:hypothetical protein
MKLKQDPPGMSTTPYLGWKQGMVDHGPFVDVVGLEMRA